MAFAFDLPPTGCGEALSRLSAVGFHEAGVRDRLGLADLNDIALKAVPIYRRERLTLRDPLASAIDLFVLQQVLPTSEMDALFDPVTQGKLLDVGLLERSGLAFRAGASLYPVGSQLVFSDHAWPELDAAGHATVPFGQVMYVGADSRWLARATERRRVASALDLCCGSGIQALAAAAHAERVTAVDINPRAVRCTAFNTLAMGHANLLTLQGDLFAPVGDRRFDLITANPPFVPAPSQDVGFRDGGPTGEDVQRRIVIGLPKHLAEGGIAQIVTQLGERRGESLERRFRTWLGGAPMDIQVLRLRTHSAEAYAIGYANGDSAAAVLGSVDRWSKNLADQGYYQVVSVLLAFSWSRDSWYREDEAEAPSRNAGDEVRAMFAAERLSRDESLRDRLRSARILRTGAVALTETQGLGAAVPPRVQARRLSVAMPVTHTLDLVERDILTSLADPRPASELLGVAARAGVAEDIVLRAMVSLVRKGLIRLND